MYSAYSVVVSYSILRTYTLVPCPVQLPPPFSLELAFSSPSWSTFVSKLSSQLAPFSPIMSELLMFQINLLNWLNLRQISHPPSAVFLDRFSPIVTLPCPSIGILILPERKLGSAELRWRVRLIFHALCKIRFEMRGSQ